MEPGDELLDGPSGGREELQAIVERAGRHRRRSVAGVAGLAAVVALAAGGGIGYAVSNHGGAKAQTVVAGNSASGSSGGGASGTATPAVGGQSGSAGFPVTGGGVVSPVTGPTYTHLFTRTSGVVTIRAYQPVIPAAGTTCGAPSAMVQADVSTPDVAGIAVAPAFAPTSASGAILSVWGQEIGRPEGHPVDVLLVQVGASVAQVKADFAGGGSDEMAPVHGWAALAGPVATSASLAKALGTVTALDAAGKTLQTQPGYLGGGAPLPAEGRPSTCFCPPIASGGNGGTGSASSGTASSGTASSGTVSSGAATVAPMCARPLPAVTVPPPPTSPPAG